MVEIGMEWSNDQPSMELVLFRSATSYQDLLEAQKDLFQTQIRKLQSIVATQCELTGVNPLSQEMAAGALSIKIGKRPRDLLNPKAIKYMQFVFSIKDVVSKRETREISTQFGVTATQVREFFTSQRSRVRNFARLSGKKTGRSGASDNVLDEAPSTLDPVMASEPIPMDTVVPMDTIVPMGTIVPMDTIVPMGTIVPTTHEAQPSQSLRNEVLSGKEKSDKNFMDSIFHLMRIEESFAGQVKLLEWILKMEKPSVLQWFLAQGGVLILTTWLSQAAVEEQTTILRVILKVLCHLPLRKALPAHMSAILQSVNRLRFYRVPDISKKARVLLSSWSKMFANSQNSNKPNGIKAVCDDEMLLKRSIIEVMGSEALESNADFSEAVPKLLCGYPDKLRKLESPKNLKYLTAAGEENNKKRGLLSSQSRERRKVKMVEPLGQRGSSSPHVSKLTSATQSRPLSADDIQKAKIRAQFMRSKYGKNDDNALMKSESQPSAQFMQSKHGRNDDNALMKSESQPNAQFTQSKHGRNDDNALIKFESQPSAQFMQSKHGRNDDDDVLMKSEIQPNCISSQSSVSQPVPQSVRSDHDEQRRPYASPVNEQSGPDTSPYDVTNSHEIAQLSAEEPPLKKLKEIHNTWRRPPAIEIRSSWVVGTGESSKEVEIQKNRIRREREIFYQTIQEIPSNPRDPWDCEIDFDDTLTPEIPMEQLTDIPLETPQVSVNDTNESIAAVSSTTSNIPGGSSVPGPDLELLAELLKNPEIVFALTSGQAGDLSSSETVKLLDRIKTDGVFSLSNLAGLNGRSDTKVETSLPSPTPSTEPKLNGVKPDFLRNPFARHSASTNTNIHQARGAALSRPTEETTLHRTYAQPHPVASPLPVSHPQPSNMLHQSANAPFLSTDAATLLNMHISPSLLSSTASFGIARTAPKPAQLASVPHSFTGMQSYHSMNHYQNNSIPRNQNTYNRGPVMAALPTGNREREFAERPGFESWSPDNSPHRHNEYIPGPNYSDQRANLRNGHAIPKESPLNSSGSWNHPTTGAANLNTWDNRRLR